MQEKLPQKEQFKKTVEAIGDLAGNKIADKITSLVKTKSKEEKDERQEIHITDKKKKKKKKGQQIIGDLRLF